MSDAVSRLAEALHKHDPKRCSHAIGVKDCEYAAKAALSDPELAAALDLGLAFAEAERALPEGWTGTFVGPHYERGYWANAWKADKPGGLITEERAGFGPTPQAALLSLAAKLKDAAP